MSERTSKAETETANMADLASSIVSPVLVKIGSLVWGELALLRSFRADLMAMERKLATVREVLFDAEARRGGGDGAVRHWLRRLKDVAHDIDDLLDECRTDLCAARRSRSKNTLCGSATNPCFIHSLAMGRKLRSLRRALDAVADERDKLQLHPSIQPPPHPSAPPRRESISMVDESKTVGRTVDKEKLMRLVLDAASDEDVSVIPIVGFGGIGKTTLAQLVFNDRRANDEVFDPRIWVSMSVGSSLRTLVQPIVSATKEKCDLDNLDAVASFLSRTFTGMKYLLVLDDVWSEDQAAWDTLRMLLKDGKRGSKIIVTTRSLKVAKMVRTVPPFMLKGLCDEDCWELFRCKAFEEGEEDLHPELVRIGKEIVQKCGGVPLAAKALGSMLRFKRNEESWVAVKDSEIWQMEKEETILPSLKLSYDQMAPGLKQCFAYCSVFPRNYEIDKDRLMQQWVALGFVEPAKHDCESVFDRANDCFENLLWMSFIQEVKEHDLSKELVEYGKYKIHDLVHDLAQSVAGDEVLIVKSREVNDETNACRHVLLSDNMRTSEVLRSMLCKSRSFHSWGYNLDINFVLQSRCLRVLDLRGSPIVELPHSVGKLKHLRYLDISSSLITTLPNSIISLHNLHTLHLYHCRNLRILPMSICSLENLETLNLSACNLSSLPDSIGNLESLKNLNLSFCNSLDTLPISIGKLQRLQLLNLKGCCNLQSLPDDICSLQNLKFLNLAGCGFLQTLPENMGNLSNLSYLNLSQCNSLGSIPDTVGCLTRLHTLNMSHCSGLSEVPQSIGGIQELQVLILSHHLSSLALPTSIGILPNLQTLDLSWNIGLEGLPESIGNLHHLKILNLFQCWSLLRLPDSMSNLLMLESLNLAGCEQLTKLPDGIIRNSNLKHLRNDQCRTLERLPSGFGQWRKLETLSLLIVGDKHSSIAELEDLNLLTGELRIECWSNKNDLTTDAKRANIRDKRKLSSLALSWSSCPCDDPTRIETFLEVLVPPENLGILEIDGYMGSKFPSWMMKSMELWLPNIVSLSLSNIHNCSCLPPFGNFPYLQSLQLRHLTGVNSMGSEIFVAKHGSNLYRSLKELHFEDMPSLEIWPTSTAMDHKDNQLDLSMFPALKIVTVIECPLMRPSPCLPDAVADLSVSNSSEMLSVGRIVGASSSASASLLRRLWIRNCRATSSGSWILLRHRPKLEDLVIDYCETLGVLPEAIRSLKTLRSLRILNCAALEDLPEWLGELEALESLEMSCCPKLASLPTGLQCLTALEELTISGCNPVLKERCREDTGTDWLKISHIPNVFIS